ncbi:MAG: hypothetical protein EOR89_23425 [Mesorhizobium sp.]|nr:MAG: hypothetical protein EOR89_23425 [Mesorhizobium sp.]
MAAKVPFCLGGGGQIEAALRRAGKGYVLGVSSDHLFKSWVGNPRIGGSAEQLTQELAPSQWRRLSARDGTKGPS